MCTSRRYLFKSKCLFKQIRGVWGIDLERLRDCFISGVAEWSRGWSWSCRQAAKMFRNWKCRREICGFLSRRYQVRRQLHRFVEVLSRLVKHRNISNTGALFQLKWRPEAPPNAVRNASLGGSKRDLNAARSRQRPVTKLKRAQHSSMKLWKLCVVKKGSATDDGISGNWGPYQCRFFWAARDLWRRSRVTFTRHAVLTRHNRLLI